MNDKNKKIFVILCLLLLIPEAQAGEYRVVACSSCGGDRAKIRLHEIDAPKLNQPYGQTAKTFAINAVLYKEVDIQPTLQGTDRYGRITTIVNVLNISIL